jgi:hypothetical protein
MSKSLLLSSVTGLFLVLAPFVAAPVALADGTHNCQCACNMKTGDKAAKAEDSKDVGLKKSGYVANNEQSPPDVIAAEKAPTPPPKKAPPSRPRIQEDPLLP